MSRSKPCVSMPVPATIALLRLSSRASEIDRRAREARALYKRAEQARPVSRTLEKLRERSERLNEQARVAHARLKDAEWREERREQGRETRRLIILGDVLAVGLLPSCQRTRSTIRDEIKLHVTTHSNEAELFESLLADLESPCDTPGTRPERLTGEPCSGSREKKRAFYVRIVLGRTAIRLMRSDAQLRADVSALLRSYATSERDRSVFDLDKSVTFIERLANSE